MAKSADQLKDENESLNEELREARALILAMRASLEDKATDQFLAPKQDSEKETSEVQATSPAMTLEDPLGVPPIKGSEETRQGSEKIGAPPSSITPDAVAEPPQAASIDSSGTGGLEEQIKDLTQQLAAKSEQCQQLEISLAERANEAAKQKTDHDEKMKKMKAIFAAANKNLNEYRQSIAAKDEEITELKSQLESRSPSEEQSIEQKRMLRRFPWRSDRCAKRQCNSRLMIDPCYLYTEAIQDLEAELRKQSESAASKLQQMVQNRSYTGVSDLGTSRRVANHRSMLSTGNQIQAIPCPA